IILGGQALFAGVALLRRLPGSWLWLLYFAGWALPLGLFLVVVAFGSAYELDYLLVTVGEAGFGLLQVVAGVLAVGVVVHCKRAASAPRGLALFCPPRSE